jgi:transposase
MAKPLVSDALWAVVAPLLPASRPSGTRGRPRVPDRAALTGIIFVLKTGSPWEYLPQELGGGSGVTCWRRLREWQQAGVWARLHQVLLNRLGEADRIDWSRVSADSARLPAQRGVVPLVLIPSIGPSRAANTIWWATGRASRWRCC